MAELPFPQAMERFKTNEDRIDTFVNDPLNVGTYTTSDAQQVETMPALVQRLDGEFQAAQTDLYAARDAAVAAADVAQLSAGVYDTTAAGIAATTSGDYFSVPSADAAEYLILYKNNAGSAVEQKRYPSTTAVIALENARRAEIDQPNLFTAAQLAFASLPTQLGGTSTVAAVNGLRALKVQTETVGGASRIYWRFPVAWFPSGKVSGQVTIDSATSGTTGTIRIIQRNSGGTQVQSNDIATGVTGAITSPTTYSLGGVTIAGTTATIDIDINFAKTSGDKSREFYVRSMLLCDGEVAVFRQPPQQRDYQTVYVATTGSDNNAGTLAAPFSTLAKAIAAVSPAGRVVMRQGDYSAGASIAGVGKIEIAAYIGERVRIILGTKLASITKTGGYTKVYQAALAIKPALLVWEHETPDARTAISASERHPLQRGRANRLPSTYLSEVANIAAVDAASTPSWYWAGGVLYFSASDGGDATGRNYYVPAGSGAIYGGTGVEDVKVEGISVWYSGLRGFDARLVNRFEANSCAAFCGQSNGFAMDDARFVTTRLCESAGNRGDGFNTHRLATNTYHEQVPYVSIDNWAHDNYDDGDSMHEDCLGVYYGGLYEYNGDRGIATSYGAHTVAYGSVSRHNGQFDPSGGEGFCAIGAVVPADDNGIGTQMDCYNCQSYGNLLNYSTSAVDASMTIVNSKSWDAVTAQYANIAGTMKLIDSTSAGTGTVKSGTITVANTTLVT